MQQTTNETTMETLTYKLIRNIYSPRDNAVFEDLVDALQQDGRSHKKTITRNHHCDDIQCTMPYHEAHFQRDIPIGMKEQHLLAVQAILTTFNSRKKK